MPHGRIADEQPLICLVNDAQWLDRASMQALAMAAQRVMAEPIALMLTVRARRGRSSA